MIVFVTRGPEGAAVAGGTGTEGPAMGGCGTGGYTDIVGRTGLTGCGGLVTSWDGFAS